MAHPTRPSKLLKSLGARARRSLGQHFLKAPWVLDHILDSADLGDGDTVLEIGPGLGVLTERLAATGHPVVALEKDDRLASHLASSLARWTNLRIIQGDGLEYPLGDLGLEGRIKVVANLPYNVATPLLFRLLESDLGLHALVVMVQKEVGDRILADPGTRQYGALTVNLAMLATGHRVVDVPPSAFHPPPKVDSTVLHLRSLEAPPFDVGDPAVFGRVVSSAFGARRKTLRNALGRGGWSKDVIDGALASVGIDGRLRGETLSVEQFSQLSRAFSSGSFIHDRGVS